MIRKTIAITEQQNEWIKGQMAQGDYGNESELIRDLIRERQRNTMTETPEEIARIRALLIEAEQSGFTDQSKEEILKDIKNELRADGQL